MNIAITGATGFLGRELVNQLIQGGHKVRAWNRCTSNISGLDSVEWIEGSLGDSKSTAALVTNCDAVIHAGLWRTTDSFQGREPDLVTYAQANIIGSLQLIDAAMKAGVQKFVYVSSCAVHEKILDDRPLDEAHPLWATRHYGAHKAAVEKFVHSFGFGEGFPICAIRPTAIYGIDSPITKSHWFGLAQDIADGKDVRSEGGGKLVHVSDVANAIRLLLRNDDIAGYCYSCCEGYFSNFETARLLIEITGSSSVVTGSATQPKHNIVDEKLRSIGMTYGGHRQLEDTLKDLVNMIADRE